MARVFLLLYLGCAPALAQNTEIDKRVAALAHELRCLVCQNQTLADSNAPLAVDLRNQIREQLTAGASEREVRDFMVARYGDFVLYRPPFKASDGRALGRALRLPARGSSGSCAASAAASAAAGAFRNRPRPRRQAPRVAARARGRTSAAQSRFRLGP